ncbi:MAG: DUF3467 domain-containing protein [Phycisphaera sp.]|nr:DUF3467 domain-containing protein [Phycisphaera sp.]
MHDDDMPNEPDDADEPNGKDGDDAGDEQLRHPDDAAHHPPAEGGKDPEGQFTQRVRHQQVSALVPEHAARGVFSTGALVLNGPHEFVVDFLQAMTRPQQVACRIILPPTIMANMVKALKQNIENYEKRFGDIPPIPKTVNAPEKPPTPPTIEDIYDQLKIPEDVASGVYANTVLITHSPTEFCLDFITSFYPRSCVASRIYMAIPQISRLVETLDRAWQQYQQKVAAHREALAAQAAQAKVLRTPEEIAALNAPIAAPPAGVAPAADATDAAEPLPDESDTASNADDADIEASADDADLKASDDDNAADDDRKADDAA